jgi:hypothetical protein
MFIPEDDEPAIAAVGMTKETPSFTRPLDIPLLVTSQFGMRPDPFNPAVISFHGGVDFSCPAGTEVKSAVSGVVCAVSSDDEYGNYIDISNGAYVTRYAHLSSQEAKLNTRVEAGGRIGLSGGVRGAKGAGKSTGPHLHFGVSKGGKWIDPHPFCTWLVAAPSAATAAAIVPSGATFNAEPAGNPLQEVLGVTAGVLATAIVVGLLSEVIQGWAFRTSESTTLEWLRPILVKISSIPGLKHIDWHKCDIRSDTVSRRDAWFELKNADYANRKCIYGICDQYDAKQPAGFTFINDVDFTDVVRVVLANGLTIFGTKVTTESNVDYELTPAVPLVVRGFDQYGERRYVQLPTLESVSR